MECICIIVDDEPLAINVLENYIRTVPKLKLAKTCNNAFEALNVLNTEKIDLMFLDIHMPKMIGTDLLKTLHYPPKVIFTTAHKDFAHDAFELDAVDYLLKPISLGRFLKAVNKYFHISSLETEIKEYDQGFVYFRSDRKMIKVFLEDILYIESLKDYIVIHRQNSQDLRIKIPIGNVETMLPQHHFVRVHRSFIVAINKISAFTKNEVEVGTVEIPIGRSYGHIISRLKPDYLNLI